MEVEEAAHYRVLDIDIISTENLSPMAAYLNEKAFILGCQKAEDLFYLSFEPNRLSEEEDTPESAAKLIINLLLELPEESKTLWDSASSKEFNFGFDSGVSPPAYTANLSAETLRQIARLGASITITIYQHYPESGEHQESEERS